MSVFPSACFVSTVLLIAAGSLWAAGEREEAEERVLPPWMVEMKEELAALNLADQHDSLLNMAGAVLLPELIKEAAGAPDEDCCRAVRAYGLYLSSVNLKEVERVESLLYEDERFWLAAMQMAPGNHLIDAIAVLLFVQNGDLDKARRLANVLRPFANKAPGQTVHADSGSDTIVLVSEMLEVFFGGINAEISKGVALHDRGRLRKAIKVYEEVLEIFPKSALANYEIFLSQNMKGGITRHAKQRRHRRAGQDNASRPPGLFGREFFFGQGDV